MKRILALTFCFTFALAQAVCAEKNDQDERAKKNARKSTPAPHQETVQTAKPKASVQQQQQQRAAIIRSQQQAQRSATVQQSNRTRTAVAPETQNTRIVKQNNIVIRNRNSFAEALRHNWRIRHNRDWWRHHFTTFVIFGGGYYYWNPPYWYPAYGYDPLYSTYLYDEPIYGYNNLPPGQVIVNVQTELRRQGYYYGAIDGLLGPMTRSALARYQATHGLIVTRGIDEPTLQMLGIV